MLAVGQHHATDSDLVHLANSLADDREGVVADLAIGSRVVGPDQAARVDLVALHELVDLDRARGPRSGGVPKRQRGRPARGSSLAQARLRWRDRVQPNRDPATGEFGDATVIRKFGDVHGDLSAL